MIAKAGASRDETRSTQGVHPGRLGALPDASEAARPARTTYLERRFQIDRSSAQPPFSVIYIIMRSRLRRTNIQSRKVEVL